MSSVSNISTIFESAAAAALATGITSFVLLRTKHRYDASEREKDRKSAADISKADRFHSNAMTVHLAIVGYVIAEVDRARNWAQAAQGYNLESQIPSRQSTDKELSLSFLLAGGNVTAPLYAFDKEIETFRVWCISRKMNQVHDTSEGWPARAQEQAGRISNQARAVISAQREELNLLPWPDMRQQLFIQVPSESRKQT